MFFLYVDTELKTDCTFECSDIKKKKQHASVCVGEHLIFSASLMSRNGKLWPLGRIFKSVSLLNFKIRHRLLYSLSQGHKLFNKFHSFYELMERACLTEVGRRSFITKRR